MKSVGLVLSFLAGGSRRRNLRLVAALVLVMLVLVAVFSVVFHVLMAREGRDHSWTTGVYWTLTVMSTLGFGDITFRSDAGRAFTVVVLISGALFILVLLPFVFIQFVFMPWVAWRDANRTPRSLPATVRDHLVLIGGGPVCEALIRKATHAGVPYVLVEPDPVAALARHDEGTHVMIGDLDDPATYRAARVDHASLVASTHRDTTNVNLAFTVREISATVPIVATATSPASVDVLALAGCTEVLELGEVLGDAMARRVLGRDARHDVIGEVGPLLVAEAAALHPDLVGRTLRQSDVRSRVGAQVVGTWDRGAYVPAGPDTRLEAGVVVILAGSAAQLAAYDEAFAVTEAVDGLVVVLGAGRVGRAAARSFAAADVPHRLVERDPTRVRDDDHHVLGDAADVEVLDLAGFREAEAVLVTSHDDDVNVYLTLYCRRLRPEVQIISRANLDRNVATLHRAGADAVLSYASFGATAVWNARGVDQTLVLAEGLEVFRVPVPPDLAGRTLDRTGIRSDTGATVVASVAGDVVTVNPPGGEVVPVGGELVLIADPASRRRFADAHPPARRPAR